MAAEEPELTANYPEWLKDAPQLTVNRLIGLLMALPDLELPVFCGYDPRYSGQPPLRPAIHVGGNNEWTLIILR